MGPHAGLEKVLETCNVCMASIFSQIHYMSFVWAHQRDALIIEQSADRMITGVNLNKHYT